MKQSKFTFKAIALLLAMMASRATIAQEGPCLVVTETNETQTYFALNTFPVITNKDRVLTVENAERSISIAIEDFDHYGFTGTGDTMIGKAIASENGNTVFSAGKAYVSGLNAGASVYVYSIDGRPVSSATASSNGEVVVDLSGLKAGAVYVLRTPSASYKVINK